MRPRALHLFVGSAVVLSASTLLLPLIRKDGLAKGLDVFVHVGNVVECSYLLREGRMPLLDWLPDIAGGRGGPNFIYYGSLGFLAPAFLVNLGLAPEDALRIWTAIIMVVGFISAALFASTVGGWLGGLTGGVFFVFGPYFFSLPYSRAGYPEHMAYALYPLALYFPARAAALGMPRAIIGTSVVYSIIVATHTLSLALLTPFLVLYLFCSQQSPLARRLLSCVAMLALSVVLMAPSLVGPVFERGKIVVDQQLGSGGASEFYLRFGIPWSSMLNQDFLDDVMSRCVPGRVHPMAIFAALLAAGVTRDSVIRKRTWLHLALALSGLLLAEQSVARLCVWIMPGFGYLQFPWRFLGIFNLFSAVSLAACFSRDCPFPAGGRLLFAMGMSAFCLALYLPQIPPQEMRLLRTRTREGIQASMTTLDHENKYMPLGAKSFEKPAPKLLLEVGEGECYESEVRANDWRYQVSAQSPCPATFHQYFFEGWKAEVDGTPVRLERDPSGLCRLELPAGAHQVRLHFGRTPLHRAAFLISGAGWAALLAACFAGEWKRWLWRRSGTCGKRASLGGPVDPDLPS